MMQRLHWGIPRSRLVGFDWGTGRERNVREFESDIVLDGLPLADHSVNCIVSQHALQQLEVWHVWTALAELWRVLRPDGVLRMGLTDLDRFARVLQQGAEQELWCWQWSTTSGNAVTQLVCCNGVRTPLNYEFVEELLHKAGFAQIRKAEYRNTQSPFSLLAESDLLPLDSFYVEAQKPVSPSAACGEVPEPGPAGQIHLSWAADPSTTFTVIWHTPRGHTAPVVHHRPRGGAAWRSTPATSRPSPGRGVLHQATVGGLGPDGNYEYRVSGDEGPLARTVEVYETRTAPRPGPADFRFAFVCDTGLAGRRDGNSTGTMHVLEALLADAPLFILGGGDYAYANRDERYGTPGDAIDAWFKQMQPLLSRHPFMAQYGNHEIYLHERYRDWHPRFAHPPGFGAGRSYSFEVGDVHFTSLFVPGPPPDAEHVLWLVDDLAQARERGMRWLVVYQHEPIYGHGSSHPARPEVRRLLGPLFEKYGVDLHLSGHDQSYERSFPLRGLPNRPRCMSRAMHDYRAGSGVLYAKVSPGGKMSEKNNDFSRFTAAQPDWIAVRDDTAHHYALITVRASGELLLEVFSVSGQDGKRYCTDHARIVQPNADG